VTKYQLCNIYYGHM